MWPRLLNALLGVWLMAAPAVLGYGAPAATHDRVVGPLIASFAVVAAAEVMRPLRRMNTLLGAWLLVAPWVLGFEPTPRANALAVGVVVLGLSLVRGALHDRTGGGWSSLWGSVERR